MSAAQNTPVPQIKAGDMVIRYGMRFIVQSVELLEAERGGFVYEFTVIPVDKSYRSTITLFPEESILALAKELIPQQ